MTKPEFCELENLCYNPGMERKEIVYKGEPAWEYENGSIQNRRTGRIMRPARDKTIRSTEQAKKLAALSQEAKKKREMERIIATGEGLKAAAKTQTTLEALKRLAEVQAKIALDPSNARASTEAYKTLLQAGDYTGGEQSQVTNAVQINLTISRDVIETYAGNVIDVEES